MSQGVRIAGTEHTNRFPRVGEKIQAGATEGAAISLRGFDIHFRRRDISLPLGYARSIARRSYFDSTAAELPERGRSSRMSRSLSAPALRLPLPPPLGRPIRLFDNDAFEALFGSRVRTVTFE